MAARNPTTFNQWLEIQDLIAGEAINITTPDAALDDHAYALDCEMLIGSHVFHPISSTATSYATLITLNIKSKDMCDVASVTNDEIAHEWCVLAWVSDGATRFTARLDSALASASSTGDIIVDGAAGATTPGWLGFAQLHIKTNENVDTLTIQVERSAGSGTLYLGGYGIFSEPQ